MKISFYLTIAVILLAACNWSGKNSAPKINSTDSLITETSTARGKPAKTELNNESKNQNCKFTIEAIDKADFDKLYSRYFKKYNPKEITDYKAVKRQLGDVVEWFEEQGEDENGKSILCGYPVKINFRNGKVLELIDSKRLQSIKESGLEECALFVSYFPEEDILFLSEENAGDGGDLSYVLATGDSREVAGNPKETFFPPTDKKHRIRGFYNGYVMIYYYQEKQENSYSNICSISDDMVDDKSFSNLDKIFFINDSTFYFQHEGDYDVLHYKKATIIKLNK